MIRARVFLLLCFVGPCLGLSGASAGELVQIDAGIDVTGDRVSVDIENTSLQALIQKIAKAYPLELHLYGTLENSPRDWHLHDKPLVDLFRQLLRDQSVVMFFESGGSGQSRLTRLDIYASNAGPFYRPSDSLELPGTPVEVPSSNTRPPDSDAAWREVSQLEGMQDDLSVEILGRNLKNSASQQARLHALQLLDELDTELARRQIMSNLGDPDDAVKLGIVSILSKWQNEEALYALAQVVFGDTSPEVRVAALEGLASFDDEYQPAARAFLESALGDRDETVAAAALSLMNNSAEP